VDGIADNVPGQMNATQVVGNHLIVDHGTGEYSVLAHLRSGSVAVRTGDRVTRGQRLGECGNSGNSSEPHLHYQLQDGPEMGSSAGLPAQFTDYLADGQPVDRGEPVQGQAIRPAPATRQARQP
ncbi:MAG TPA: M23 family metallopeptidase, partial [Longimicrobium sp.]